MSVTERLPLTRRRIADAALALIDAHGLDALSMRKIGAELGVEAMSLYNHVTNKADLLDAVAEELYAEVLVAYGDPVGDWKVHARALSHAYVDVAAAHPAAVSLLIDPADNSASARAVDARIIAAAGLMTNDARIGSLAFSTVANWVIGTIVQEHGLIGQSVGRDASARERSPMFQDVVEEITADERFNEGLEIVLAGLEARFFSA